MTIKNETMTKEEKMQELAKKIADDVIRDSFGCNPGESDFALSFTELMLNKDELEELIDMVRGEISEADERCEEVHRIIGVDGCNWARKFALIVVDGVSFIITDYDEDTAIETSYTLKWCYVCGDSAACDSMPIDEVEFNTLLSEHDGGICDSIFDVDD